MSTETIYGGWSTPGRHTSLDRLWMKLSAQQDEPNFGLTQRKHEIFQLWDLYVIQSPRVVLEIGVSQGGTFAGWCQLGRHDATLIGIDRDTNDCRPRPGDPGNTTLYSGGALAMTENGGGMYSLARAKQSVHAIKGWSHEPRVMEELMATLGDRKVDWLYHDASHGAEMFAADWKLYWPLVAEGGVFAVHDIAPSADPNCNKSVEWRRILAEETYSAAYQYLPHPSMTEMGTGVIIK